MQVRYKLHQIKLFLQAPKRKNIAEWKARWNLRSDIKHVNDANDVLISYDGLRKINAPIETVCST